MTTEKFHNGLPIHFSMTDFFEEFGVLVVDVHKDSAETGDYRYFPEESHLAEVWQENGYEIVTIWQETDENSDETVTFEFERAFDHPYVTGYMVLQRSK